MTTNETEFESRQGADLSFVASVLGCAVLLVLANTLALLLIQENLTHLAIVLEMIVALSLLAHGGRRLDTLTNKVFLSVALILICVASDVIELVLVKSLNGTSAITSEFLESIVGHYLTGLVSHPFSRLATMVYVLGSPILVFFSFQLMNRTAAESSGTIDEEDHRRNKP